ncbi:unnamed protein product [Amaranthus hypochondriacus]
MRLSDLSYHPCFWKNTLCNEQLQSDHNSLSGKLDLNLQDCGLLIKSGVLGETSMPSVSSSSSSLMNSEQIAHSNIRELLARL